MDQQLDRRALLNQLLGLEALDRIPRTGFLQRGVTRAESVAEHSWHVATVAWTLLPYVQPLDGFHVLELALLHDVGELLIGDLPRPARRLFPADAKESAEEQAFVEVLGASGERSQELAAELRQGVSAEAKFVHHCDRLQLLLKTATYAEWQEGATEQFFESLTQADRSPQDDNASEKHETQFSVFRELRSELIEMRR